MNHADRQQAIDDIAKLEANLALLQEAERIFHVMYVDDIGACETAIARINKRIELLKYTLETK